MGLAGVSLLSREYAARAWCLEKLCRKTDSNARGIFNRFHDEVDQMAFVQGIERMLL